MKPGVEIIELVPSVSVYQELRKSAGWYRVNDKDTAAGLKNSLYSVCALFDGTVIGCGRIVGDGGIYFYIQDVIVFPEYQRAGTGRLIMQALMKYLNHYAGHNAFIGLMAAHGVADFYLQFGFKPRDKMAPGMFMVKVEN